MCSAIRIVSKHFQMNLFSWRIESDSRVCCRHAHGKIQSFHINVDRREY